METLGELMTVMCFYEHSAYIKVGFEGKNKNSVTGSLRDERGSSSLARGVGEKQMGSANPRVGKAHTSCMGGSGLSDATSPLTGDIQETNSQEQKPK